MSNKPERSIPFVSSSILNTFVKCKYNFYEQYIMNDGFSTYREDDGDEAMYLTFGTLIHESIQDFWQSPGDRTFSKLRTLYESKIEKYGFTDIEYIRLGYQMVENFFHYLIHDAPKRRVVASELSFKVEIGGVPLHGTIDQIYYRGEGVYEIEDYKTSKWVPTQDEVDENIQLAMYDLVFSNDVMKQHWYKGIRPKAILLSLHFLRYGEIVHTEHSKDDRIFALNYFRMLWNQMKRLDKTRFRPCPSNLCSYCGSKTCPYYKRVLSAKQSDEIKAMQAIYRGSEISDEIEYYNALNNRRKILESESNAVYESICDRLKETDSVVSVGGFDYFMGQNSYRSVNVRKAIQILESHGLWDPLDFISSLPLTHLERMLADYPDVWEEIRLKALSRQYRRPQLKVKKSKPKGLFQ